MPTKDEVKLKKWDINFVTSGYAGYEEEPEDVNLTMRVIAETFDKATGVVYSYYPSTSTAIRSVKELPYVSD